ncbi:MULTISPECIES: barstar family protein [Streptomyces]|uniref:barstar family protein n=1 Tax=Streptomyces TaxID=1883 RepID=UPI00068E9B91|nr:MULTISPECIES: barstar family protein [Streptomyces]
MIEDSSAIHISPWLHIVTPGAGVPLGELLPRSGSVYVAYLDGREMTDEVATFQEFQEALKFPDYFGWNWNAFHDCLRDLQWLSSDHHVLIVESAEHALSEDEPARKELLSSLWNAGRRWSYVKRPEGVTLTRLSIVLSTAEDSLLDLSHYFQEFDEH